MRFWNCIGVLGSTRRAAAVRSFVNRVSSREDIQQGLSPEFVNYVESTSRRSSDGANLAGVAAGDAIASLLPPSTHSKLARAARMSSGAIFDCTSDDGAPFNLRIFITDWSPCEAACAVAVPVGYRGHNEEGFTGRFVRHPVTDDLLPVFTANWVRRDFGTGAVLINPAHDAADLAFAKAVGLPVRAGTCVDGTGTSLDQPLPQGGVVVRSRNHSGVPYADARSAIFEQLQQAGRALPVQMFSYGEQSLKPPSEAAEAASRLLSAGEESVLIVIDANSWNELGWIASVAAEAGRRAPIQVVSLGGEVTGKPELLDQHHLLPLLAGDAGKNAVVRGDLVTMAETADTMVSSATSEMGELSPEDQESIIRFETAGLFRSAYRRLRDNPNDPEALAAMTVLGFGGTGGSY